jgi:adenylate kinase
MIILMGIAGSGKGTQGKILADEYGYHWISSGDILRMYVTGERRHRMLDGELLDDDETIRIWDKVLASIIDKDECVLDGFPRTIPQAEWLLEEAKHGRFKVTDVIHMVASREAVTGRLLERGRQDDHTKAIEARFNEYERSTKPIIDWFKKEGIPVIKIDAEQPIKAVHQEIIKRLKLS